MGWMGSLVDGMRDASGQMYRRNRYYDPGTGRFTREDPIGIAGGLNVYGFANGAELVLRSVRAERSDEPLSHGATLVPARGQMGTWHNQNGGISHPIGGAVEESWSTEVERIESREKFVAFVQAIKRDLDTGSPRWENTQLSSYLEAIAGWVEDMDGFYHNRGEPVPNADWRTFAQILAAACWYE